MVANKDAGRQMHRSHLFTLRLWLEEMGAGQKDWRGKVQHVDSGEARYFHDWPTLEEFLEKLIFKKDDEGVE